MISPLKRAEMFDFSCPYWANSCVVVYLAHWDPQQIWNIFSLKILFYKTFSNLENILESFYLESECFRFWTSLKSKYLLHNKIFRR